MAWSLRQFEAKQSGNTVHSTQTTALISFLSMNGLLVPKIVRPLTQLPGVSLCSSTFDMLRHALRPYHM
jgi:hypothetical protein